MTARQMMVGSLTILLLAVLTLPIGAADSDTSDNAWYGFSCYKNHDGTYSCQKSVILESGCIVGTVYWTDDDPDPFWDDEDQIDSVQCTL